MKIPWWVKIVVGAAFLIFCWVKMPLMDIAVIFVYCFLVPLAMLSSVGLIADGTMEALGGRINDTREAVDRYTENAFRGGLNNLAEKITGHREVLKEEVAA